MSNQKLTAQEIKAIKKKEAKKEKAINDAKDIKKDGGLTLEEIDEIFRP